MKTKLSNLTELIAFSVIFYLFPIALLYFKLLPFNSRHVVLVAMSLVTIAYAISKPIKLKDLGFRKDTLKSSFLFAGFFTISLLITLYLAFSLGILKGGYNDFNLWFVIFYIFISAPLQEFVFRSLMIYELGLFIKARWLIVVLSALIYSFAHAMYHDIKVLIITFLIGLIWGWIYQRWPNFWAVAISHAILGAATVFIGLV